MKRINSFHDEDAQGWWSKDDDENVDAKDVIEDDDAEDEFKDIDVKEVEGDEVTPLPILKRRGSGPPRKV